MGSRQRLSLKGQALKYLSMREHSRMELRRKMLPYARLACAPAETGAKDAEVISEDIAGGPAEDLAEDLVEQRAEEAAEQVGPCLDKLLDWLEANGLLSQERFVESRVRIRAPRFGTSRIRQELSQHGVDMPAALRADLEQTEVDRARQVWARKFGGNTDATTVDAAARAKQMRFLAARGFSSDAIRRVVWSRTDAD